MSENEQNQNEPRPRRTSSGRELNATITLNVDELRSVLGAMHQPFIEMVLMKLETIEKLVTTREEVSKVVVAAKEDRGVDLSNAERLKATDLRTALLLGKVPDIAGLLIDTKTTAKLLNISSSTLSRLNDLQAIPASVRIGGTIIRWRLAEILAWMDAGCPLLRNWKYPEETDRPKRR